MLGQCSPELGFVFHSGRGYVPTSPLSARERLQLACMDDEEQEQESLVNELGRHQGTLLSGFTPWTLEESL